MKKIGIITILNVNNYGAELQAFALNNKLRKLGYESEIINYLYYKNPRFKSEALSNPLTKVTKIRKLKDIVLKWIDKYSAFKYPKVAKRRKERFDDFHKKFTNLSKEYRSYSDLYSSDLIYDIVMVGSDQVWNPNNGTNLDPYFLTFAKTGVKKISYASSFGVGSIDSVLFSNYNRWISNIDFLGVRESDGVNIIKKISNRSATHVVDPTMLLSKDEWKEYMVPYESNKPYILLFAFKKSDYVDDVAYKIQQKTGYKIIRVCKNEIPLESDDKILNIRDFGPSEFLGLYNSASFVITTSFHGTVFSILFEKPFYTITPASKNNNSRQQGILELFNLKDRLLEEGSTNYDLNNLSVDFMKASQILHEEKERSLNFLIESIEK